MTHHKSFKYGNALLKAFLLLTQVNESVLRPTSVEALSDLQLAEELIKQEMITMLHFDCLHHPSANSASQLQRSKSRGPTSTSNNASHIAYLESNSYQPISTEEMEQVTGRDDSHLVVKISEIVANAITSYQSPK